MEIFSVFQLRTIHVENDNEKVGWIKGLIWQNHSAINYNDYQHVWYGPPHLEKRIFRIIHT